MDRERQLYAGRTALAAQILDEKKSLVSCVGALVALMQRSGDPSNVKVAGAIDAAIKELVARGK